mmetsp:Transcript_20505/g.38978  ORF Transcript_20505/g.38978 Transcript_20505/m.38978 type:complete len:182 (-) Transcript_20505:122-667(-)|eukprot:CAMPEP_0114263876 /NCGR_PEP_ID=MMETSP0058-20121206/22822_1 /TAXON_ID=36894 /ORGANISM="Pyramimonas parkeae, CCMP726" /LENGTH=181 /DNA_ID=CAMNT_0001380343 /DNA_START=207 /DNA_END=752 /DNA_ORIENTATION=+
MKPRRELYRVLGVARDADANTIKQAYRALALQLHPDRHIGSSSARQSDAAARFKEASHAYSILIHAGERAQYDMMLRRSKIYPDHPHPEHDSSEHEHESRSTSGAWEEGAAYATGPFFWMALLGVVWARTSIHLKPAKEEQAISDKVADGIQSNLAVSCTDAQPSNNKQGQSSAWSLRIVD